LKIKVALKPKFITKDKNPFTHGKTLFLKGLNSPFEICQKQESPSIEGLSAKNI